MGHSNKIMGAAVMLALLTFFLVLAEVVSTDAYSTAAQAQANGDLALMQLAVGGNNVSPNGTDGREHQVVTQ